MRSSAIVTNMALTTGAILGPYEIISQLGSGGMGEVYRGKDKRLGRDAAIKILATEFAEIKAASIVLEQEARSASALNHPNIINNLRHRTS